MAVAGAEFEQLQGWIGGENAGRVRQIAGMWTEAQAVFSAEGAALRGARSPLQAGGWKGEAAQTFYDMQGRTEQSFATAAEGVGQVAAQLGEIADVIDRVTLTMQGLQDEWNQRMASVDYPTVETVETNSVGPSGDPSYYYRITVDGEPHVVWPSTQTVESGSPDIAGVSKDDVRRVVAAGREHVRQDLTERARHIMKDLERTYMDRAGTLLSLTPNLLFNGPINANVSGLDLGPAPGAGGTGAPFLAGGSQGGGLPPGAINPDAGGAGSPNATTLPPGAIVTDAEVTAAGAPAGLPPGAVRRGDIRQAGTDVSGGSSGLAPGAIRTDVAVGDALSGAHGPGGASAGLDPAAVGLGSAAMLRTMAAGAARATPLPPGAIRSSSGVPSASLHRQGGAGAAGSLLPGQAGAPAGSAGPQTPPMPLTPTMAGRQGGSRMPGSASGTAAPGTTLPPGTPAQLGGRRSGGQQRESGKARGAIRGARSADTAHDDTSLPRIAGRGRATPVAAVRMPDLPGSVVDEPALTREAPAPQLGRLRRAPAQPGRPGGASDELGRRRQRTATDDVVLATGERAGTTLTARPAPTGTAPRTDLIPRRRRGTRPVPPPERPNEEVWSAHDGSAAKRTDAIVDTPTPTTAEQAAGPALGRDRIAQAP